MTVSTMNIRLTARVPRLAAVYAGSPRGRGAGARWVPMPPPPPQLTAPPHQVINRYRYLALLRQIISYHNLIQRMINKNMHSQQHSFAIDINLCSQIMNSQLSNGHWTNKNVIKSNRKINKIFSAVFKTHKLPRRRSEIFLIFISAYLVKFILNIAVTRVLPDLPVAGGCCLSSPRPVGWVDGLTVGQQLLDFEPGPADSHAIHCRFLSLVADNYRCSKSVSFKSCLDKRQAFYLHCVVHSLCCRGGLQPTAALKLTAALQRRAAAAGRGRGALC